MKIVTMKLFWQSCVYLLVAPLLFCCTTLIPEGFVANTLIRTPAGHSRIQDLSAGDEVFAYDFGTKNIVPEPIVQIKNHKVQQVIQLTVNGAIIETAEDQPLFVPLQKCWLPASQITTDQYLLGAPSNTKSVSSVAAITKTTYVYTISLAKHHTYLVSQHNIVVHNFAESGTIALLVTESAHGGFLAAFLAANPLIAPIVMGIGGIGLTGYFIWALINTSKESKAPSQKNTNNNSGNTPHAPNENNSGHEAAGGAAAFLKSLDDNKEKAAEVFRKSYEWITSSNGLKTIKHCFDNKPNHNFAKLLVRMGGDTPDIEVNRTIQRKILAGVTQKLIEMGSSLIIDSRNVFEDILVEYGGEKITVQGFIHDGIIKVSTMFIQGIHVR